MHLPETLRIEEEVVESFGVSKKYTILIILIGFAIIVLSLVIGTVLEESIATAVQTFGPLAPLIATLLFLVPIVLGLYLIALGLYFQLAYQYFLTTERVIQSIGLFAKDTTSAEYKGITDITLRQDLFNRLIGTGTLLINTAGGPMVEIKLVNIDRPSERKELLRQLAQASHRGKKITRDLYRKFKHATAMATREEMIASPEHPSIEDLHSDGIDESDRLRAAQKRIAE
ncbi:PH domain-containing protein [Candidatus Berkelbacteria bacterium]|nr:PH domain-containing protein [Candidatus Berkelbacteria bacterium]